jgi:hypothetical protein
MHKFIRFTLIILIACLTSGCGLSVISSRDSNPVIEDAVGNQLINLFKDSKISTFATTASRRLVLIREYEKSKGEKVIATCAEPSPDVGEAFASAVADAIKVAAPIKGVPVEVSNQYARTIATQISPLVYRTQDLQLYRDAIHSLCIDKMNGWVDSETDTEVSINISNQKLTEKPTSYEDLRKYYFDEAAKLIEKEFPNMRTTQAAFFQHSKTGEAKASDRDIKEILEAIKSIKK